MTAYIESVNNFPTDDWGVWALLGFRDAQINIVFFEEIEEVPKSRTDILVASIKNTNEYLARFGIPPKKALNIPPGLEKYAGRQIDYMTMAEFRQDTRLPIFFKAADYAKKIDGIGVMRRAESKEMFFSKVPDDQPLLVSEVVNFVSEYRGYVVNGKLEGVYWYIGDFRQFIDCSIFDQIIADYKDAPAGYSIDLGLTDDGRTLLIECNDGWSLGNYGLNAKSYIKLLIARWRELMKEAR